MNQEYFIPKISIIGVGGAGVNGVNHMMLFDLDVNFIIANTDAQSISHSLCKNAIRLGAKTTRGLGAGADFNLGKIAAEESVEEIKKAIEGSDMLFVTSGMGGGTGTGASPVVAKIAKEMGILTVGVVTKPFSFEGPRRQKAAEFGIRELEPVVDTLIVISNDNLLRLATEKTGFAQGFKVADEVLYNSVKSIVELLTKPGFINRDFADLRTVMSSMGRAMIGYAEAEGEDRVNRVIVDAIFNPILENDSIDGASSVLLNITGGSDLGMLEVQKITEAIRSRIEYDANFLFGTVLDEEMCGKIRVSVIATGMHSKDKDKDTNSEANKERDAISIEELKELALKDDLILQRQAEVEMNNAAISQTKDSRKSHQLEVIKKENPAPQRERKSILDTIISLYKNKTTHHTDDLTEAQKEVAQQVEKVKINNKKAIKEKEQKIAEMPLFNYQKIIDDITESKNIIKKEVNLERSILINNSLEEEMLDIMRTPAINRVA